MRLSGSKSKWSAAVGYLAAALLFYFSGNIAAQRYSLQEYTEGLGNLNVTSIVQDHTGYLWVGTQNGIYRYDGNQFKRFGREAGLPERTIASLYVSNDGTLWAGTAEGIYFRKQDGGFAQVKMLGPLTQRAGTVFAEAGSNRLVAATQTGAVELHRVGINVWVASSLKLEGKAIRGMLFDRHGVLWYGCDHDLCRMTQDKSERVGASLHIPSEEWVSMLLARNGHIWLRGPRHVGELNPDTNTFTTRDLPGPTYVEPYPNVVQNKQGHVLVSAGLQLGIWNGEKWRVLAQRNGLPPYEIDDMFVDREGSVWLGVSGHGLRRWSAEDSWESYTMSSGLNDNLVWDQLRDKHGRLWIATEQGLNWIDAGGSEPRTWHAPGIEFKRVSALTTATDGAIWAGSSSGTLVRIDARTLLAQQWKIPAVYRMLTDRLGNIWVATAEGLFQINQRKWMHGPHRIDAPAFGKAVQLFSDLALDSSGNVWAAAQQGVFELSASGWIQLDLGRSGAHPDVITFDKQGNLWTAGPSQKLMRMRPMGGGVAQWETYERPEILSDQIVAMLTDSRGWIWVGQDAGISVFDGTEWHSFTREDGLVWNDVNSNALREDTDGSILIGTSGGLAHLLNPKSLATHTEDPPVFSEVSYGSTKLSDGGAVTWDNLPLDISMAVLSFKSGHEATVRYRMKGAVDTGWDEARDFSIRYGHLEPGHYQFEVTTVAKSGRALSKPVTFQFMIRPRWWQRASLRIGLFFIIVIIGVLAWRWRVGQLIRQRKQLESAVRMRTDELEREKNVLVGMREQMRHFAEHDGLSGLWNHRVIVERLRGEVDRSRRDGTSLSIILADVDFFKKINDTYGHPVGDRVLKEVSALFQGMVRSYDWVGRYGGEEFLLVLPGTNLEQAELRAEQLRRAIEAMSIMEGADRISVTISLGVAAGYPTHYDTMVQAADTALYQAKNSGRNRVVSTGIERPKPLHARIAG